MVTKVEKVGRSTGYLERERRESVCVWGGSLRRNWEKGIHLFIHHET